MIQLISHSIDSLIEKAQIHNHAGLWVRASAYKDLSMIRVSVDAATPFLFNLAMQGVSGIEEESLA